MSKEAKKSTRNGRFIPAILKAMAVIIAAIITAIVGPIVVDKFSPATSGPGIAPTPTSTAVPTLVSMPTGTPTVTFTPTGTPSAACTPASQTLILKAKDFKSLPGTGPVVMCGSKYETREEICVPVESTQLIVTIVIPWGGAGQGLHGPLDSGLDIIVDGDTKEERITEQNAKFVTPRPDGFDYYLYVQGDEFSHTFDISGKAKVNLTIKVVGGEKACLDFQEARLEFR